MARSPYTGTFQPNIRPTVVMSPDATVLINGESNLIGCSSCRKTFDINKYVTSIQVDLNIDSAPGSASISLTVPRHTADDLFFDGECILTPMMEIEVYAKGYFLIEGVPQYYPSFWGLITEVSTSQSGSDTTVSIQCADILKWWELCQININPAYTAPVGGNQMGWSIFGNVLFGRNPYDMIFTLAHQSFGDVVLGTGSLVSLYREGDQPKIFKNNLAETMLYWEKRFSRIRSNLLLYGINGVAVRGSSISEEISQGKAKNAGKGNLVSSIIFNANGKDPQSVFDPTDPGVTAFRTQFMSAGDLNFFQAEFQTKLEIANLCKEAIGFEFFMDVTGDIVFKPPFYNLDILSNKPLSWIQDIDIISEDLSESEAEVVTQLQCNGNWGGNTDYGMPEELTPHVTVTDYHLLRKYGWRTHTYDSTFMGSATQMFYHGMDVLDRLNARRFRGTVTIPLRPELRLGFPVYLVHRDQIWYVSGISHNIEFGGRATTTLTLTARRGKFHAPRGIGTLTDKGNAKAPVGGLSPKKLQNRKFTLKLGDAATFPPDTLQKADAKGVSPYEPLYLRHPKTGRSLGYPNAVMVYTRPFKPTVGSVSELAGKKPDGQTQAVAKKNQATYKKNAKEEGQKLLQSGLEGSYDPDQVQLLRDKLNRNRYSYGLTTAGVYVYAYDKGSWINQFALLPGSNITASNPDNTPATNVIASNMSVLVRPVSDERGFEVIGHYRYGRGVTLRDGSLIVNPAGVGPNQRATVSFQSALSGDLFASLTAQSQGLTTIYTGAPNPGSYLATLDPTDLATGAVITPEGKAEILTGTANFIDAAPLGSPEQVGTPPSVEAGQLSRALTIAELGKLNETVPDDNCVCLSGRQELAFLNVGYQVQVLPSTGADASKLFGSLQDLEVQVSDTARFTVNPEDRSPYQPAKLTYKEVQGKIDAFLYNLYSALDTPHQEYEDALRGGLATQADTVSVQQGFGPGTGPTNLTPPYSGLRRQALGDPAAIAQDFDAAKNRIGVALDNYGAKLQSAQKQAGLQGQLSSKRHDLSQVQARLAAIAAKLQEANDPNAVTKLQEEQKALEVTRAEILQTIANLELKLAQAIQGDNNL